MINYIIKHEITQIKNDKILIQYNLVKITIMWKLMLLLEKYYNFKDIYYIMIDMVVEIGFLLQVDVIFEMYGPK